MCEFLMLSYCGVLVFTVMISRHFVFLVTCASGGSPVMQQLQRDKSWRVRYMAADHFCEVRNVATVSRDTERGSYSAPLILARTHSARVLPTRARPRLKRRRGCCSCATWCPRSWWRRRCQRRLSACSRTPSPRSSTPARVRDPHGGGRRPKLPKAQYSNSCPSECTDPRAADNTNTHTAAAAPLDRFSPVPTHPGCVRGFACTTPLLPPSSSPYRLRRTC